jgi:hypothetical protein
MNWLIEAIIVVSAAVIVAVLVVKFIDSFGDNRWD